MEFNTINIFLFSNLSKRQCDFNIVIFCSLQSEYLKQTCCLLLPSSAVSWHCELAAMASGQWCQATSANKGGGPLHGKEGPWSQCESKVLPKRPTMVLDSTAATNRPQHSQREETEATTIFDEVISIMRG